MMTIQKAVIARAKMCETDLDCITKFNTLYLYVGRYKKGHFFMLDRGIVGVPVLRLK